MVGAVSTPASAVAVPISEPKQAVLVYKQNADGSTSNTGQLVHLTQTQILQLLATSAKSGYSTSTVHTSNSGSSGGITVQASDTNVEHADVSPTEQHVTATNRYPCHTSQLIT